MSAIGEGVGGRFVGFCYGVLLFVSFILWLFICHFGQECRAWKVQEVGLVPFSAGEGSQ